MSWRHLGFLCPAALWDCMSSLRHTNALGFLHHAQTFCFSFCLIKSSQRHVVLLEGRIPMFLRVRIPVQTKLRALYQECSFHGGAGLLTAKWKPPHSLQYLFLSCSSTLHFSPSSCCIFPQLCVFLIHPSCKGQLCPHSSPDASTVPTSAGGQDPRGSGRIMAPM